MSVILDTNIFLSALISPGGTPDQIYRAGVIENLFWADYLITGDARSGLLQRGHEWRTRIVTPAPFYAERLA